MKKKRAKKPKTHKAKKSLSQIQRLVARTYDDGKHSHIKNIEEAHDVGDTLFLFLMIELSKKEDCHNIDTAIRRVGTAIGQLIEVKEALQKKHPQR